MIPTKYSRESPPEQLMAPSRQSSSSCLSQATATTAPTQNDVGSATISPSHTEPSSLHARNKLPTELLLHVATFLDEESMVPFHQTSHTLFNSVKISNDQITRYREHCYEAAFEHWRVEIDKGDKMFCAKCQCYQPMAFFAFSQAISKTKSTNLECLQHAQYMLCPHQSLDYSVVLDISIRMIFSFSTKQLHAGRASAANVLSITLFVLQPGRASSRPG